MKRKDLELAKKAKLIDSWINSKYPIILSNGVINILTKNEYQAKKIIKAINKANYGIYERIENIEMKISQLKQPIYKFKIEIKEIPYKMPF